MKPKRINPWPTPEKRLAELSRVVQKVACGTLYWDALKEPERKRCGGNFLSAFQKYGGTLGICQKLTGVSLRRAVLDVAATIDLISEKEHAKLLAALEEEGDGLEARIRHAIQKFELVVVEVRRDLYFRGTRMNFSRHLQQWKFMRRLIEKAPTRRHLSASDISEVERASNYLSKLRSEVFNREGFPPEFRDLITSPDRNDTWVLQLDAGQVCVINESD